MEDPLAFSDADKQEDAKQHKYQQRLKSMLLEPIKVRNCLKIESIHGQLLVEMAQKCTEFEQETRPNAFTLWKYIEKFEQNLSVWRVFNESKANKTISQ